jgi:hypothetical protein
MQDLLGALSDAVISPDGVYRYRLSRVWEPHKLPLVWLMLNPSTANAAIDDPTIRRCISFSKREGAGGLEVLNLFALRATNPKALSTADDPIGPDNDQWIKEVLAPHSRVICAWGSHGALFNRASNVVRRLRDDGLETCAFGLTGNKQPRHPLYVLGGQPFVGFSP